MSSSRNQLSIYIRNCLNYNRGGRPNEIELRIVSTDVSSATGEDRTKVILSTCESSSSCREFRNVAVDTADIALSSSRKCSCPSRPLTTSRCTPFRRRVSFCDAAVIGTAADDHCRRATIMQNDDLANSHRDNGREPENNEDREIFYDIWQADDSSAGRSDDGYSESTPRLDNYAENYSVSDCASNRGQRSHPENIDEQTIESDGRAREGCDGKSDVCPANRIAENKTRKVAKDDTTSNEDLSSPAYKNIDSISCDEYRMRGGCGACCCGTRENVWRSLQDHDCCCGGSVPESNESCAFSSDAKTACTVRCCYHCSQICKKVQTRCDVPPCTIDVRSCSGGGCRGGCRKPGQICTAPPRTCNSPAYSSRGRSPCAPRCPPQSPCSASGCRSCCSGIYECGRSRSPRCQSTVSSGYCVNNGTKCGTDGACCRLRSLCECLGGGLDCRRCGRKVYQAEMQIASGVPYHSICFSCFCCRKPLESLTYQENCGEIYCKQCYVRNFGPQGYGYGAGAGVLQTPL